MSSNQFKTINWRSIFFLCVLPIATFVIMGFHLFENGISWAVIALTVFYYFASGLSITAGYHRLFSHKTYEASLLVRLFYLFFGAGAFQDSVLTWCTDHRYHHKYTDTDKDPYNAKRGFWFSHMGWMLSLETPVEEKVAKLLTRDLRKDPWVMFQHKFYVPIALFSGFAMPAIIGSLWGEALSAFIFAGLFRTVMVHQYTFFINSLAHIWGKQTYGTQFTAKDNHFISFFTYGEGYHNFHHHFQNDYRNGIRWYDYDPTKWSIKFLGSVGLAYRLKKTPEQEIILAKVREKSRAISTKKSELFDQWSDKIETLKEKMDQCALHLKSLQEEYNHKAASLKSRRDIQLSLMRREIKLAQKELKLRYSHWKTLVAHMEKSLIQPVPL